MDLLVFLEEEGLPGSVCVRERVWGRRRREEEKGEGKRGVTNSISEKKYNGKLTCLAPRVSRPNAA